MKFEFVEDRDINPPDDARIADAASEFVEDLARQTDLRRWDGEDWMEAAGAMGLDEVYGLEMLEAAAEWSVNADD